MTSLGTLLLKREFMSNAKLKREFVLQRLRSSIDEIRGRFGVKKLLLFGSVAHDEARSESDVDLLVEFNDAARFDQFMELKFFLEELLNVRVDLTTRVGLRTELQEPVERDAIHVS